MLDFFRFKIYPKLRLNSYTSFYSSHSQFGEDMIVKGLFPRKKDGFYIDLGAHHPLFYSNTYHFYLLGWRGINIDAQPGSMDIFKKLRPEDINVEACLGGEDNQEVTFYEFDQPALNTIDDKMAQNAQKEGHQLLNSHKLKTKKFESLLKKHLKPGQKVDLLNIDIEGLDELVLRGLDWNLIKPEVIIFEDHHFKFDEVSDDSLLKYVMDQGYELYGKAGPSLILKLK